MVGFLTLLGCDDEADTQGHFLHVVSLHLWGWELASERAGGPHCTHLAAYERGWR